MAESYRASSNVDSFPLDEVLLASIFSYLDWRSLVACRSVGRTWKDGVTKTNVAELFVGKLDIARNLLSGVLAKSFPRMQRLEYDFRSPKNSERFAIHDEFVVDGVAQFHELSQLELRHGKLQTCASQILQLSNLRRLDVSCNTQLKWTLHDIASSLKNLQYLRCQFNRQLTGDLADLRPLSDTLQVCDLEECEQVQGNLLDVATFPRLQDLALQGTKVSGDIRDILPHHFPVLSRVSLGDRIYGGCNLWSIADAPSILTRLHKLQQERPHLVLESCHFRLSRQAAERYAAQCHYSYEPPFEIEFLWVGCRKGWRWTNSVMTGGCDIQWLDPEPQSGDLGYEEYCVALEEECCRPRFYKGYSGPPTEGEHGKLVRNAQHQSAF